LHSALCKLMGKNPHPFLMFVEPWITPSPCIWGKYEEDSVKLKWSSMVQCLFTQHNTSLY
jgi:hypothetical protein